jgi:hypothetical protein
MAFLPWRDNGLQALVADGVIERFIPVARK